MAAEVVQSIRPGLAPLVSLICALLIITTGAKRRDLREFWSLTAASAKLIIVLSMIPMILQGKVVEFIPFSIVKISPSLQLYFRVDAMGQFFAVLSSFLWMHTTIYSIGYMRNLQERNQTRYFFSFAMCIMATVGIAYAGNLFTLFIFYEILSIAAYPLVIHHETDEAMRAGRKYLTYVLFGGSTILGSLALTYLLAGNLNFSEVAILNSGMASKTALRVLFITFIMGFGVKTAIMPLHDWLPSAMVAPTPVSALLHAVAVVKAGVFGIIRVIYSVYGPELTRELGMGLPLAYIASVTIILGSVYAFRQDNLKRMLAYSTVSQLSYIVLGAALLTRNSLTGSIAHIAYQAVMKITLFFCAGAIFVQTGKKNISEMDGIGRSMPITMGAFTIAAAGLIGLPPVAGFITKWYLMVGAMEAGQPFFVFVLLLSSLLNATYFVPPIYIAYFHKSKDESIEYNEAPLWLLVPLVITALFSLGFGIFPNMPYTPLNIAHVAVRTFLPF